MTERPAIVVLGGAGRVGRLVSGALRDAASSWHWQGRQQAAGIDWVCDPLTAGVHSLAEGLSARKVTTVLVLWGVVPAGAGDDPELNVILAKAALEAARIAGVPHVLLASSIAVYGASLGRGEPVSEACPALAETGYGGAKLRMERMAADFCEIHGATAPGVTVLRLANVLGADQLSRAILSGDPVVLDQFPNGSGPKRSYLSPGTLVRAVQDLAQTPPPRGRCEVFNLADGSLAHDMSDIVAACQARGMQIDWQWRRAGEGALPVAAMDTAAIEARLPRLKTVRKLNADQLVTDWCQSREAHR